MSSAEGRAAALRDARSGQVGWNQCSRACDWAWQRPSAITEDEGHEVAAAFAIFVGDVEKSSVT
ncbi:MAG: hypothetical protein IPQ09_18730 [Myxococcales bacterium]|nr:hypothetical protein [Myxococcales bacterium]